MTNLLNYCKLYLSGVIYYTNKDQINILVKETGSFCNIMNYTIYCKATCKYLWWYVHWVKRYNIKCVCISFEAGYGHAVQKLIIPVMINYCQRYLMYCKIVQIVQAVVMWISYVRWVHRLVGFAQRCFSYKSLEHGGNISLKPERYVMPFQMCAISRIFQ